MSRRDEQLQRTARVLQLLDASYVAHHRGDRAECEAKAKEAAEVDVDVVSVTQGGIIIGEIPDPAQNYNAWRAYVDVVVASAAAAR